MYDEFKFLHFLTNCRFNIVKIVELNKNMLPIQSKIPKNKISNYI